MSEEVTPLEVEDIQKIFDASPFMSHMKMKAESVDHAASELTCTMPMQPFMERRAGTQQFHGGPIAAFIDTAGDYAMALHVGAPVPTINYRVDYLRPAMNTSLTAVAKVRRAGRTVGVVDIDITDDKGRLVTVGRGCYAGTTG